MVDLIILTFIVGDEYPTDKTCGNSEIPTNSWDLFDFLFKCVFGRKNVDFSNLDVTWNFLKVQVFADSVNLLMVCKRTLEPFASKTVGFAIDVLTDGAQNRNLSPLNWRSSCDVWNARLQCFGLQDGRLLEQWTKSLVVLGEHNKPLQGYLLNNHDSMESKGPWYFSWQLVIQHLPKIGLDMSRKTPRRGSDRFANHWWSKVEEGFKALM